MLTAALALVASAAVAQAKESSRVFVSATLNSTIQVFDSKDYTELQPPLASKGGGPVRLWIEKIEGKNYLLTANHGSVGSSLGIFDLSTAPVAVELPLSPFPARAGSVGVVAGKVKIGGGTVPMAFVTNTFFSLTPCSLNPPAGSVTGYDLTLLATAGIAQVIDTVDVSGGIPFAVGLDGDDALAFVSSNCSGTLDTIRIVRDDSIPASVPIAARFHMNKAQTRAVGSGPDATLYDAVRRLVYTLNIGGGSVTVHDASSNAALTTIPLAPGAFPGVAGKPGPIDGNFAETPAGRSLLVTSNGGGDSVSAIDRDVIEECVALHQATCARAEVLRVKTAVTNGAPEGIDYDPRTNRIFTVNKNIANPSLSVVQLTEHADGSITGEDIHRIPIVGVDSVVSQAPALIAFDVVVEKD
jgi:hypothetical protein